MPETLKLNDGTVLENASAILSSDLFLYIRDGRDMKAVFDLLIDPEKTKKIVYTQANGEPVTFVGYKKLIGRMLEEEKKAAEGENEDAGDAEAE